MKETEAARAVLLEVLNALGAMRDDLIIVGGWVPDLLYPSSNHMGSLDVDLARKVRGVSQAGIGKEALELLRAKFRTFDSIGPVWAGRAASIAGEDPVQFQRAAFEDAAELFRRLDAI